MAKLAQQPQLTIQPEGELRAHLLPSLVGSLGIVHATGILEISRNRLLRRFVFEGGVLRASVSNAREDRLLEWLLQGGRLEEVDAALLEKALEAIGEQPLTGGTLTLLGVLDAAVAPQLLTEHLLALLGETLDWKRALYRVVPGRLDLGLEPVAEIHGIDAALHLLSRMNESHFPARYKLPAAVIARIGEEELAPLAGIDEAHRRVLELCREPAATGTLPTELHAAAVELWRGNLLAECEFDAIKPADGPSRSEEVSEQELLAWLKRGEREDLAGLLGVQDGCPTDEARRAYYRTVRRFHPDRFRQGPLSSYYDEVERSFRLVQQALAVLTDPGARRQWERRHDRPDAPDPKRLAKQQAARGRQAAAQGRRADAVGLLEQAVKIDPEAPEHVFHLALLLIGNPRRRREALSSLETLCENHPGEAKYPAALALALERAGQSARCRRYAEKARNIDVRHPLVRFLAGENDVRGKLQGDPFLAPLLTAPPRGKR